MSNFTALEVVARLRKWQDDSIAGGFLKAAADLIEAQTQAAPIAVSDQLAESARAYAGDVGLSRPHPLWSAVEAYENARAITPDVLPAIPFTSKRESPAPESAEYWLGEILAVMHGDGGHYRTQHGNQKATEDAIAKWHACSVHETTARHECCKSECFALKCERLEAENSDLLREMMERAAQKSKSERALDEMVAINQATGQYDQKPSASTDDNTKSPCPLPSSVECPKCRTQLAFQGDECGLCKEEES